MDDLLYLTFDSLQEGVGASQALAYVHKIAGTRAVKIISFEKEIPTDSLFSEVENMGTSWTPLPFGRHGVIGGISRVLRMWWSIDRKKIIHARGNLAALAALMRFPKIWIWDCRSLHADQRRALTKNKSITPSFICMRVIEYILSKRSTSIIVITKAVIPVFMKRYGIPREKIHMISTCVDEQKFQLSLRKRDSEIRILLAGTFSPAYDLELMNNIIIKLKEHRNVFVTIATSKGATNAWAAVKYDLLVSIPHKDMPRLIAENDLGMSIWKNDLGICLKSVASTKVAEFLACGKPVFVNALQGDIGDLVANRFTGVVTHGSSESEIDSYVRRLLVLLEDKSLSKRCRQLAEDNFSLEEGVKTLQRVYSSGDF